MYTFKVHPSASKPEIHDAVEAIWGVEVVKVNTLNRKGKVHARPSQQPLRLASPTPSGPSSPWQRATRSRCSRTELNHGHSFTQAHQPRPPLPDDAPTSPRSPRPRPEKSLLAAAAEERRPQRLRPQDRRATAAAATSGQYRIVDFKRIKDGVTAKVAAIEYDPNRTCRIALLHYADGEKAYILAPKGLTVGDHVRAARAPTSSRATPCRCATSRSAPPCTTSSCAPAAAARWPARPAWPCSWSPRKASSPPCACPPPRCAAC